MSLQNIVDVTISLIGARLTTKGFGVPLIISPKPTWVERAREYSDADDAVTDSTFLTSDPEYLAMTALFAQEPSPEVVVIGRQAIKPTQRFALTPVPVDDAVYRVKVNGTLVSYVQDSMVDLPFNTQTANFTAGKTLTGGTSGAKAIILTNTDGGTTGTLRLVGVRGTFVLGEIITDDNGSPGSATAGAPAAVTGVASTVAEIVNGLRSLVDALAVSGLTMSDQTTYLRGITALGGFCSFEVLDPSLLGIAQDHADPGLATDLLNIQIERDDWYAVLHLRNSKDCIAAIALWVEANEKLFIAQSQDTAIITTALSGATDIAATLHSSAYARSSVAYHPSTKAFMDCAWAGRCLPLKPGSETWKFKTLATVPAYSLTATHRTNAINKKCNIYETIAGINITSEGTVAVGEFIDTVRGRDWMKARLQEDVFAALAEADKIPFTDGGATSIQNIVQGVLDESVRVGLLSPNPAPVCTVPKVASVSTANKAARHLPDVNFDGVLAGAVHSLEINGKVSV